MSPPEARDAHGFITEAEGLSAAHRFSHEAMAAQFHVTLVHDDASYARQAVRAAFEELDRLERELSRFIENSDIARLNRLPVGEELPLGPDTFECLWRARQISQWTGGAFDVSVGPLYACWLNEDRTLRQPSPQEIAAAARRTGMDKLILDRRWRTARVTVEGMRFDLGGIGKGYAVDRMTSVLAEWRLDRVLIHGGASSLLANRGPASGKGWPVSFSDPRDRTRRLTCVELARRAAGGSGLEQGRHIIDPRPGRQRPVDAAMAAWSLAPDATTADALSTAFMIMEDAEIERFIAQHPDMAAMVLRRIRPGLHQFDIRRWGAWPEAAPD